MFQKLKSYILSLTIFFFPLFFLRTTQEFFLTNKLYLLCVAALSLLLITSLEIFITRKIIFRLNGLAILRILFLVSLFFSIMISSPNKVQAVLNPYFGFLGILSLTVISFYINQVDLKITKILSFSSLLLSLIMFFNFFKQKGPFFSPLGTHLDLTILLGFSILTQIIAIISERVSLTKFKQRLIINLVILGITSLGLVVSIYFLFKGALGIFPSFKYSFLTTIESLKNPLTALFGVGIDNYASGFTKIKDQAYNQSSLWQISFFNVSRSTLLHVATEAGILGLASLLALFFYCLKNSFDKAKIWTIPTLYLLIIFAIFPPSIPLFFLFFISLAVIWPSTSEQMTRPSGGRIWRFSIITTIFLFVLPTGYFLGRSYIAEYYFKKSIDALVKNDAKGLYDNQRLAIKSNPYIERFRINFSQTNLLIANNLSKKSQKPSPEDQEKIARLVQAAIAESKAVVTLNPQKASNWENMANVYKTILKTAKGADSWAISSYQRTINLDPQNPQYRLGLGGVYYSLDNFAEAIRQFEQAEVLKPGWPNAYFNLAWAYYKKGDSKKALKNMQTVISLLDPQKDKADIDRAKKDLEQFRGSL
ncbi:tetratricopeptide repeat protein [Candidatus Roizmanbacteria bacterium]|nr:tetratricopeptide repeat protein [Candidatus Roizmanbacteria bacterium]